MVCRGKNAAAEGAQGLKRILLVEDDRAIVDAQPL